METGDSTGHYGLYDYGFTLPVQNSLHIKDEEEEDGFCCSDDNNDHFTAMTQVNLLAGNPN